MNRQPALRIQNIPENLIKFKEGTWWLWRAGHRVIPLLCHGFVRRNKSQSEGFKLTFVWKDSNGVLVKVHPKYPAQLEPIPEGEGHFDYELPVESAIRYRPFQDADEFQPFADFWFQAKQADDGHSVYRVKPVVFNDKAVVFKSWSDATKSWFSWLELFERFVIVGGPWKPAGMPIRRKR